VSWDCFVFGAFPFAFLPIFSLPVPPPGFASKPFSTRSNSRRFLRVSTRTSEVATLYSGLVPMSEIISLVFLPNLSTLREILSAPFSALSLDLLRPLLFRPLPLPPRPLFPRTGEASFDSLHSLFELTVPQRPDFRGSLTSALSPPLSRPRSCHT